MTRYRISGWWFAVPILTWGTFAWAPFLYVACRARARDWFVAAAVYFVAAVTLLPAAFVHPERLQAPHAEFFIHWALTLTAVLHLAAAGGWFSRRVSVFEHPDRERAEREALARAEAKRLIAADPARAKELRIGRPDLGTTFDGGLVDVNHVPASVIATLPDMTGETARRLAAIRDDLGGFSSLEDLDQVLDLPIGTVDRWRPVAVFLP